MGHILLFMGSSCRDERSVALKDSMASNDNQLEMRFKVNEIEK